MTPSPLILLLGVVAYFALLYVMVCWKILRTQRMRVWQRFEELGVSSVVVPASTLNALDARTQELAGLGFELRGVLVNIGYGDVSMVHAVHATPDGRMNVTALAGVKGGQQTRHGVILKLDSERADGSYLSTNNSPLNAILPRDPNIEFHQFPQVMDARRLVRAHEALIARHTVAAVPRAPKADLAQWIGARADAESARQCELGTFRREGELYRFTLRGALRATWRFAPPWSWLLRARTRMRAERLLSALERPGSAQ